MQRYKARDERCPTPLLSVRRPALSAIVRQAMQQRAYQEYMKLRCLSRWGLCTVGAVLSSALLHATVAKVHGSMGGEHGVSMGWEHTHVGSRFVAASATVQRGHPTCSLTCALGAGQGKTAGWGRVGLSPQGMGSRARQQNYPYAVGCSRPCGAAMVRSRMPRPHPPRRTGHNSTRANALARLTLGWPLAASHTYLL